MPPKKINKKVEPKTSKPPIQPKAQPKKGELPSSQECAMIQHQLTEIYAQIDDAQDIVKQATKRFKSLMVQLTNTIAVHECKNFIEKTN